MLAASGHDLRGPLHTIIGLAGLLLDTELSPEQRQYAEGIRTSGDLVLGLLGDVLDLARIECGTLELASQPFDTSEVAEVALEVMATAAAQQHLDLVCSIADDTPGTLLGDGARVRQILVRLLLTLMRWAKGGELLVEVTSTPLADARHDVRFIVKRTTGSGTRVSGFPTDRSTVHMRLALAKRLSEAMGGTLWVEDAPAKDFAFHFTISGEAVAGEPRAHRRGIHPDLAGRHVLIADDSAAKRRVLTNLARAWGMSPRATASASDALAWIRGGDPFDVAVLDSELHADDGVLLTPALRRFRDAATLPVVLVNPAALAARSGVSRGAQTVSPDPAAILSQPIRPAVLFHTLIQLFHERPAPRISDGAPPEDSARAASSRRRVLLAEDSPLNQKIALGILQHLGCEVDAVSDGAEALEALSRRQYDVVFMDVEMPGVDGLTATRQIRERWPKDRQPRIVAMTADDSPQLRARCVAAGMDDYLGKTGTLDAWQTALERAGVKQ